MKKIDYVELYARKLKNDPSLFKQQKMLIESQLNASQSLFEKKFSKGNFKQEAREYLRKIGKLK